MAKVSSATRSGIFFVRVPPVKDLTTLRSRIPWGSSQATEYLLKLIQLKYPTFPTRVTSSQANVSQTSSLVAIQNLTDIISGCFRLSASSPAIIPPFCALSATQLC